MPHYGFPDKFQALYQKALQQFAAGQRGADTFCTADETRFLQENGLTPQNIYDYAEDHHSYGEPGFAQALAIELVRRDYFINIQLGRSSTHVLDREKMPAKTDAVQGIEWLPRLIPKARAKLRGELPKDLMYCCGGDRRFFTTHDIMPAEFLSLVWRHDQDDTAVINWVLARTGRTKQG